MNRLVLTCILVVYALLGLLYAIYTPKWQAPDEPAHFNYIRTIGETGKLPILESGDYDQNYLAEIKSAKFPASMPIDAIRYESYQPPLYYIVATPVYWIASVGGLNLQVIALRLFSVALGLIVLLVAYAIIREIFPDDDLLTLATVGLMATVPMHIAVSASISNDLAAELLVVLILWLAVKRLKNTITDKHFVILGGILFGAALLTKTTAFVPGAVLLIGAELAHITHHASRTLAPHVAVAQFSRSHAGVTFRVSRFTFYQFILAALISAPMFIRNMLTYGVTDLLGMGRHDSIVIGQPTTAEMIRQYGLNHILFDFFAVTFKSFWAQFGWMGVLVNDRIYVLLFALTGMAVFGLVLYAWKIFHDRSQLDSIQWWFVGLLALLLITAIADYIGYNFKFFQLQGRYLFPGMIAIAFFWVAGLRELIAREYHRLVFVLLYVAFIAFDLASLFLFIIPQLRIAN